MISQGIKAQSIKSVGILETYFSASEVVLSIPTSFSLAGGYGAYFGGAALGYTIPYRIYIGIRKSPLPGIQIASMQCKNRRRNTVSHFQYSDIFPEKELCDIQRIFFPLADIDTKCGYVVDIYLDHDWIDVSSIQIAMVTALLVFSGKIPPEFFSDAQSMKAMQYLEKYKTITTLIWKFQYILDQNSPFPPCGAEIVAALIPSKYPIVFAISDPSIHVLFQDIGVLQRKADLTQLPTLNTLHWVVKRFEDVGHTKPFPVDIALIHPGFRKTMNHYLLPPQYETPALGDASGVMNFLDSETTKTRKLLPEHVHTYTLLAAKSLDNALITGKSNEFLFYLCKAQNALLDYVKTREQGENFSKLEAFRHLHGKGDIYLYEKMAGSDIKILLITPKHMLQELYSDLNNAIALENEHAELEYFSQDHTLEKSGIRLEKSQSDKIDTQCSLYIAEKKIFLGQHQITSQDIPSTFFTLKVLMKMRKRKGKILSTTLPMVSYTQNTHDCKEKILKPLMRAMTKYLGLTLECTIQKRYNYFEIHFQWQDEMPTFIVK